MSEERFSELLRLYRGKKLNHKAIKDVMAAAAAEDDMQREAARIRQHITVLKYIAAIEDDERFLADYWRQTHALVWYDSGGGI